MIRLTFRCLRVSLVGLILCACGMKASSPPSTETENGKTRMVRNGANSADPDVFMLFLSNPPLAANTDTKTVDSFVATAYHVCGPVFLTAKHAVMAGYTTYLYSGSPGRFPNPAGFSATVKNSQVFGNGDLAVLIADKSLAGDNRSKLNSKPLTNEIIDKTASIVGYGASSSNAGDYVTLPIKIGPKVEQIPFNTTMGTQRSGGVIIKGGTADGLGIVTTPGSANTLGCEGDSGGPLYYGGKVIGIHSRGDQAKCNAGTNNTAVDVGAARTALLNWIAGQNFAGCPKPNGKLQLDLKKTSASVEMLNPPQSKSIGEQMATDVGTLSWQADESARECKVTETNGVEKKVLWDSSLSSGPLSGSRSVSLKAGPNYIYDFICDVLVSLNISANLQAAPSVSCAVTLVSPSVPLGGSVGAGLAFASTGPYTAFIDGSQANGNPPYRLIEGRAAGNQNVTGSVTVDGQNYQCAPATLSVMLPSCSVTLASSSGMVGTTVKATFSMAPMGASGSIDGKAASGSPLSREVEVRAVGTQQVTGQLTINGTTINCTPATLNGTPPPSLAPLR